MWRCLFCTEKATFTVCESSPCVCVRTTREKSVTVDKVGLRKTWCQNSVLTSLLPLALIRGNVALVSVLMGCEPRGVFPPFLLNRKSTLEDVMA